MPNDEHLGENELDNALRRMRAGGITMTQLGIAIMGSKVIVPSGQVIKRGDSSVPLLQHDGRVIVFTSVACLERSGVVAVSAVRVGGREFARDWLNGTSFILNPGLPEATAFDAGTLRDLLASDRTGRRTKRRRAAFYAIAVGMCLTSAWALGLLTSSEGANLQFSLPGRECMLSVDDKGIDLFSDWYDGGNAKLRSSYWSVDPRIAEVIAAIPGLAGTAGICVLAVGRKKLSGAGGAGFEVLLRHDD